MWGHVTTPVPGRPWDASCRLLRLQPWPRLIGHGPLITGEIGQPGGVAHLPRKETLRPLIEALGLTPHERDAFLAAERALRGGSSSHNTRSVADHSALPHGRVPVPPTPLVGRESDIAAIRWLLEDPPSVWSR
jgi:hypothetical protein